MEKSVGRTKDVGFQFGIRKTFSMSTEKVWDFLFSKSGLQIWLGSLKNQLQLKMEYSTEDDVRGVVRVFKPNSHIRLTWKPKHWENTSTVQIRVIGKGEKTTIAIHQEKLMGPEQRLEMKAHWNKIMATIANEIENYGKSASIS